MTKATKESGDWSVLRQQLTSWDQPALALVLAQRLVRYNPITALAQKLVHSEAGTQRV